MIEQKWLWWNMHIRTETCLCYKIHQTFGSRECRYPTFHINKTSSHTKSNHRFVSNVRPSSGTSRSTKTTTVKRHFKGNIKQRRSALREVRASLQIVSAQELLVWSPCVCSSRESILRSQPLCLLKNSVCGLLNVREHPTIPPFVSAQEIRVVSVLCSLFVCDSWLACTNVARAQSEDTY